MSLCGRVAFAFVCVLAVSVPALAADGVLIVSETVTAGMAVTSRVQMEPTRMRAEVMVPSGGGQQVVIFDGTKEVLYIIDAARKSYIEMTAADMERLSAQMRVMMESMKGMLANLPPERRVQLEAMMGGRGSAAAEAAKPSYKRAGSGKSRSWPCDVYQVSIGGADSGEICTVQPGVLGLRPADFAVSDKMNVFASSVAPQAAGQIMQFGEPARDGFSGVPVRSSITMMGMTVTSEVVSVARETFPDSLFAVPAGYQKQSADMGMGMPGRGRQ
jgi:Domain of unknown function (DUF4412)